MRIKLAVVICALTKALFAQEICPVENVNVFGGDSRNVFHGVSQQILLSQLLL